MNLIIFLKMKIKVLLEKNIKTSIEFETNFLYYFIDSDIFISENLKYLKMKTKKEKK